MKTFYFIFENLVSHRNIKIERTYKLFKLLNGDASNFFYETCATECSLTAPSADNAIVKATFMERCGSEFNPEDILAQILETRFDRVDLLVALNGVQKLYKKANVEEVASYQLLREAVKIIVTLRSLRCIAARCFTMNYKKQWKTFWLA